MHKPPILNTFLPDPALMRLKCSDPAKGDPMLDRTPLGRFAEPWEMAHGVVYLVSPSSSQMSGQMLLLDGGITTCGTPCGVV